MKRHATASTTTLRVCSGCKNICILKFRGDVYKSKIKKTKPEFNSAVKAWS